MAIRPAVAGAKRVIDRTAEDSIYGEAFLLGLEKEEKEMPETPSE